MERSLYFKVLYRLGEAGIGNETDLSDLFENEFTLPKTKFDASNGLRPQYITEYLSLYVSLGYMEIIVTPKNHEGSKWMSPVTVMGTLLFAGANKLEQMITNESIVLSNRATQRNAKSQTWISWTTVAVAVAGTIISLFNFLSSNSTEQLLIQHNKRLELIEKSLQERKPKETPQKNPTTYRQETYHKL